MSDKNRITPQESDEYDPITNVDLGVGEEIYEDLLPKGWNQPGAADTVDFNVDSFDAGTLNLGYQYGEPGVDTLNLDFSHLPGGMGEDHITLGDTKPKPDLSNGSTHKYQEDKGIADLKDYVISTYKGHYTNKNSDVQTLDLIHSVGDAESFCRSNALKYLSRYDKKGTAKNDILKAMHYCLLLYYFSGNTKEPDYTNTRYETF